jgi:hypothetical protein
LLLPTFAAWLLRQGLGATPWCRRRTHDHSLLYPGRCWRRVFAGLWAA